MAFCKTIVHVVQQGDTFYRLAQRYQTTVPDIIMRNPGVNPYNLQVGTRLNICTGKSNQNIQMDELAMNNDMRQSWSQHMFWTLLFENSLFNRLPDLEEVRERVLKTPQDIGEVFASFYPQSAVNQLTQQLTEHTALVAELLSAMQAGEEQNTEPIERRLRQNVEEIARTLSAINTEYDYEDLVSMLNRHLDMLKLQAQAYLNGAYEESIRLFDETENEILELANYLTRGLMEQFYRP